LRAAGDTIDQPALGADEFLYDRLTGRADDAKQYHGRMALRAQRRLRHTYRKWDHARVHVRGIPQVNNDLKTRRRGEKFPDE